MPRVSAESGVLSARQTAAGVRAWAAELAVVGGRVGRHFTRSEPRRRSVEYWRGLLGDAGRKNGWQWAEFAGDARPSGVQHRRGRADGDADRIRAAVSA